MRVTGSFLLLGGLVLACWCGSAVGQATPWERYTDAGQEAYRRGHYAEAEKLLRTALKEAEELGENDLRLAKSLNNLGLVYHTESKYAEAEPLFKRGLAILEKVLGPDHPDVAQVLNNLGA